MHNYQFTVPRIRICRERNELKGTAARRREEMRNLHTVDMILFPNQVNLGFLVDPSSKFLQNNIYIYIYQSCRAIERWYGYIKITSMSPTIIIICIYWLIALDARLFIKFFQIWIYLLKLESQSTCFWVSMIFQNPKIFSLNLSILDQEIEKGRTRRSGFFLFFSFLRERKSDKQNYFKPSIERCKKGRIFIFYKSHFVCFQK